MFNSLNRKSYSGDLPSFTGPTANPAFFDFDPPQPISARSGKAYQKTNAVSNLLVCDTNSPYVQMCSRAFDRYGGGWRGGVGGGNITL